MSKIINFDFLIDNIKSDKFHSYDFKIEKIIKEPSLSGSGRILWEIWFYAWEKLEDLVGQKVTFLISTQQVFSVDGGFKYSCDITTEDVNDQYERINYKRFMPTDFFNLLNEELGAGNSERYWSAKLLYSQYKMGKGFNIFAEGAVDFLLGKSDPIIFFHPTKVE